MNSLSQRVNSFKVSKNWPHDKVTQTPEQFAEAGFFRDENILGGDLVICFHCLCGIKNWNLDDDPLTEHAKYFPTCSFIFMHYYEKYTSTSVPWIMNDYFYIRRNIVNKFENGDEINVHDLTSSYFQIEDEPTFRFFPKNFNNNNNPTRTLITNEVKTNSCVVCLKEKCTVLFFPCQHKCTCLKCFRERFLNDILKCPKCTDLISFFSIPYM